MATTAYDEKRSAKGDDSPLLPTASSSAEASASQDSWLLRHYTRYQRPLKWLSVAYRCYLGLVFCFLAVDIVSDFCPRFDDSLVQWLAPDDLSVAATGVCPQQDPWKAPADAINVAYPEARVLAERLSGAVKIDTSVHDEEPPPEEAPEPWTARFEPFRDYLSTTYKSIHAQDGPVKRELVHEHALLYTWQGSDESLKPLLLMAHQDVVPVDPQTIDDWLEPPWSGNIVNNTVFGRGSTDAKAWLISILSSVEALFDSGFEPRRTILLGFGYDEEANGPYGAQPIAQTLEKRYGRDSLAMIVDEGNPVLSRFDTAGMGIDVAIPGVEEKGNAHMRLRIEGPGGHSSGPPKHTTIGLLSEILADIETSPPHKTLKEAVIPGLQSAHLKTLQCVRDSPAISHQVRQALKHLDWASRSSASICRSAKDAVSDKWFFQRWIVSIFANALLKDNRQRQRVERAKRALLLALPDALRLPFATTQTPTVIHGGIKLNAIPPSVHVEIDHRVGLHHSIQDVWDWYYNYVRAFAKTHNLDFSAFGKDVDVHGDDKGAAAPQPRLAKVFLEAAENPLSPTPTAPTSGPDAKPWDLLSSVIRNVWQLDDENATPVLVAPSQMRGNTDVSHWYRSLSRHLFRFGPASLQRDPTPLGGAFVGVHGVSEHFNIDGLEKAARFYARLIQAVDAAEGL